MYALNRSEKKLLVVGVFALTFNAMLLHWTSIYVGSTPWLILALGLSVLYLPLVTVARWGMTSYPLVFIVLEQVRNQFPFGGFGWARLAYSQADAPYAVVARYGGAVGLSAITLLIALFIFQITQHKINVLPLIPLLLVLLPLNITSTNSTKVLLIQGNVPQLGLDFNSRATQVFFNHVKETKKALTQYPDVDFVLWPENAVDVDPFRYDTVNKALNEFDKPLIIGAIIDKNHKIYNVSILWTKHMQSVYSKMHLTPFGEYIPFRSLASKISPLVNDVRDFSPGNQEKTFTIGAVRIAPIICYEILDDQLLEKAAKRSNILAVQTNSATFGRSAESAQQLSITRIRAIEHSRNVLSVSTTGYSALIDYTGKVVQSTSMATAQHLYGQVGLIEQRSPRDRYGDWALVMVLIWLLLVARRAYGYRR